MKVRRSHRPSRRVGPIDLVASRYGVFCQGLRRGGADPAGCAGLYGDRAGDHRLSADGRHHHDPVPHGRGTGYRKAGGGYLPGWHCDITGARKWEDLPAAAQNYIQYLEQAVGCKITYISVGAEREAYIRRT